MSDDAVLAALTGLNERLDRLEAKVDAAATGTALTTADQQTLSWLISGLGNFKERAPTFVEAASTVANNALHGAQDAGIDPVDVGIRGLHLATRAARPQALDLAERLLDDDTGELASAALSPKAVAVLSQALTPEMLELMEKALADPELVAFALEFASAVHHELQGRDITAIASKIGVLTAVLDSPEFDALIAGGLTGPIGVAANASTALVETQSEGTIAKVGPFGAFFKLMDSDVQKAIGFTLAIAKRFGSKLP